MDKQKDLNINVKLSNTTSIETEDGNKVFEQGYILRKVSKFIIGSEEDALIPIMVFYCPVSGKILKDSIPAEIRDEYEDDII